MLDMLNQMIKIKKIFIDANILYGPSLSQTLPYDEPKFERNVCLYQILNTPDNSDIGFFRSWFKISL